MNLCDRKPHDSRLSLERLTTHWQTDALPVLGMAALAMSDLGGLSMRTTQEEMQHAQTLQCDKNLKNLLW